MHQTVFFRRQKYLGAGLSLLLLCQFFIAGTLPVGAAASASADYSFASGAFRKVWEGPDLPVAQQKTSRSYTWGPEGWAFSPEEYDESPGGHRLVQYFDKTRMEITNPGAPANNLYYVTNGLLVKEMVSGLLQLGNTRFRPVEPSEVPVAGDAGNNPGPTYRSFKEIASLNLDNHTNDQPGEPVNATIDRAGKVSQDADFNRYNVKNSFFSPTLGHNIPDIFYNNFLIQQGQIFQNGQYTNGLVFDWLSTMGYPLTEAYWSKVVVAGQTRDVLIQLFERRVLTFTPVNPAAYRVEMGNVGAHYYAWRYLGALRVAPWTNVSLINQSGCVLTVALTGQDTLVVEVAANATKAVKLAPGDYSYRGSACNAAPRKGEVSFDPNSLFDWKFYFI